MRSEIRDIRYGLSESRPAFPTWLSNRDLLRLPTACPYLWYFEIYRKVPLGRITEENYLVFNYKIISLINGITLPLLLLRICIQYVNKIKNTTWYLKTHIYDNFIWSVRSEYIQIWIHWLFSQKTIDVQS